MAGEGVGWRVDAEDGGEGEGVAVDRGKHLFQMTVSSTHSINCNGLQRALTGLGLADSDCATRDECDDGVGLRCVAAAVRASTRALTQERSTVVQCTPVQRICQDAVEKRSQDG
jgi:hypothetical protein